MLWPLRFVSSVLVFLALLGAPLAARAADGPTIFAAASLSDALKAVAEAWQAGGRPAPRLSFAASSALARQIEQGAPADLFLSADESWMDYVQERGLVAVETRASHLGNALVLVAPTGVARPIALVRGTSLAERLGPSGRLAVGDPAHVPAGKYAQAALQWMGAWRDVEPRLARAENVRAALLLVARGEAPLGIVYATDARATADVAVIGVFPGESHPGVTYPFALLRRAAGNQEARAMRAYLTGPEAAPIWERFGFLLRR